MARLHLFFTLVAVWAVRVPIMMCDFSQFFPYWILSWAKKNCIFNQFYPSYIYKLLAAPSDDQANGRKKAKKGDTSTEKSKQHRKGEIIIIMIIKTQKKVFVRYTDRTDRARIRSHAWLYLQMSGSHTPIANKMWINIYKNNSN